MIYDIILSVNHLTFHWMEGMKMGSLLLAVIYLIFISLGLPDSLLGSGWPTMQLDFGVPSSYAGYVSMTISCMMVFSALFSPRLIRRFHTKWIVIVSIGLTVLGLLGSRFQGSIGCCSCLPFPTASARAPSTRR